MLSAFKHVFSNSVLPQFVFPAPPSKYTRNSFPEHLLWIPAATPATAGIGANRHPSAQHPIPCLWLPHDHAEWLVLWSHGNGADLGIMYEYLRVYAASWKVHVMAYEYPGYGLMDGPCTEDSVNATIERTIQFLTDVVHFPLERIILFGHSIGSGPTCWMGSELARTGRRFGGIILQSAYTSLTDILIDHATTAPTAVYTAPQWPNLRTLASIKAVASEHPLFIRFAAPPSNANAAAGTAATAPAAAATAGAATNAAASESDAKSSRPPGHHKTASVVSEAELSSATPAAAAAAAAAGDSMKHSTSSTRSIRPATRIARFDSAISGSGSSEAGDQVTPTTGAVEDDTAQSATAAAFGTDTASATTTPAPTRRPSRAVEDVMHATMGSVLGTGSPLKPATASGAAGAATSDASASNLAVASGPPPTRQHGMMALHSSSLVGATVATAATVSTPTIDVKHSPPVTAIPVTVAPTATAAAAASASNPAAATTAPAASPVPVAGGGIRYEPANEHIPVLLIHGDRDTLISHHHSEQLYAACPSINKQLVIIHSNHNDYEEEDVIVAVRRFLRRIPRDKRNIEFALDHKYLQSAPPKFGRFVTTTKLNAANGRSSVALVPHSTASPPASARAAPAPAPALAADAPALGSAPAAANALNVALTEAERIRTGKGSAPGDADLSPAAMEAKAAAIESLFERRLQENAIKKLEERENAHKLATRQHYERTSIVQPATAAAASTATGDAATATAPALVAATSADFVPEPEPEPTSVEDTIDSVFDQTLREVQIELGDLKLQPAQGSGAGRDDSSFGPLLALNRETSNPKPGTTTHTTAGGGLVVAGSSGVLALTRSTSNEPLAPAASSDRAASPPISPDNNSQSLVGVSGSGTAVRTLVLPPPIDGSPPASPTAPAVVASGGSTAAAASSGDQKVALAPEQRSLLNRSGGDAKGGGTVDDAHAAALGAVADAPRVVTTTTTEHSTSGTITTRTEYLTSRRGSQHRITTTTYVQKTRNGRKVTTITVNEKGETSITGREYKDEVEEGVVMELLRDRPFSFLKAILAERDVCSFLLYAIWFFGWLALAAYQIALHGRYHDSPCGQRLALWLLVSGVFALVDIGVTTAQTVMSFCVPRSKPDLFKGVSGYFGIGLNIASAVLLLFRLCWFVTGSVWVYKAYDATSSALGGVPTDSSVTSAAGLTATGGCPSALVVYTWWIVTLHWIVAAAVFCGCIVPVVTCLGVAHRRKNNKFGIAPPHPAAVSLDGITVYDNTVLGAATAAASAAATAAAAAATSVPAKAPAPAPAAATTTAVPLR